jgi:acetyl esterase
LKLLALLLMAAPAFAQVTNMPAHVQQRLAEVGPGWGKDIGGNIEKTLEVYTPLLAVAPKHGITVQRDVAYGSDARHRADLFRADGLKNAPVVVFLHGGAYVRGDRDINSRRCRTPRN